jgi:GMP synthase (glutamine-hydrolysing)
VLRHTPVEGLGLLANALRDFGVHHRYLDVARGDALPKDVRAVGGVIVLGGPMGAYETESHPFLKTESALVEKAMAAGRPVLGVCLGAQLIAQVLGARVYPGERREVGWAPVQLTDDGRDDPLFAGLDDSLTVFHFHGDTYELPPDAANLARSSMYEQQAFRWGDTVYGFQFHLEFTESIIARLAQEPEALEYMTAAGVETVSPRPPRCRGARGRHAGRVRACFQQCGLWAPHASPWTPCGAEARSGPWGARSGRSSFADQARSCWSPHGSRRDYDQRQ